MKIVDCRIGLYATRGVQRGVRMDTFDCSDMIPMMNIVVSMLALRMERAVQKMTMGTILLPHQLVFVGTQVSFMTRQFLLEDTFSEMSP